MESLVSASSAFVLQPFLQVVNSRVDPLFHTEGDEPEPVGTFISLQDADSVNSAVTVDEVMISVEDPEVELLSLQETDPNITVVGSVATPY